ncbi:MAG: hypothetical protein O3A36_03965 [bacterium]|nr:hypothetical protein [bacterium]
MILILKRLFVVLLLSGVYGIAVFAQTHVGPKLIPRDRTSPSIHEGASGERSAGVKTNVNPLIGQVPASYSPFQSFVGAIGSLVQPYNVDAPVSDSTAIGFKYNNFSRMFFPLFSRSGRADRLYAGTKGLGGENITDVAALGQPGGKNPGDPYWVAYPRPGNVENPIPFQLIHHQYDCFCRWDETINCPLQTSPFWHVNFGAPFSPPIHLQPVSCQACFGVHRIRKHDFYVGKSKSGAFDGYPFSYPTDTGYQECLRQSVESYAASGPGGAVQGEGELYGL